jgi:hypothetical protein
MRWSCHLNTSLVEVSADQQRQQQALARHSHLARRVVWLDAA